MKEKKDNGPNTLSKQAWERAISNKEPRTGYPWDWEDYEKMTKPQAQQKPTDKELEKKKKDHAQDRRNG